MSHSHTAPADVQRYIETHRDQSIENARIQYERYMRPLRAFGHLDASSQILEIGTGNGWFPMMCKLEGYNCKGLEISPHLVEFAREYGRRHGAEPDIEVGNLEDADLGAERYDAIVASNVFEHVRSWKQGLAKVHRALKPGGAMYWESTNKFSLLSGEFSMPLYGWLPDRARYRLRRALQGDDIMQLGIDFHQFTHAMLRREMEALGFTRVLDRIDLAREEWISSTVRKIAVRLAVRSRVVRSVVLTFADATRFVCVK